MSGEGPSFEFKQEADSEGQIATVLIGDDQPQGSQSSGSGEQLGLAPIPRTPLFDFGPPSPLHPRASLRSSPARARHRLTRPHTPPSLGRTPPELYIFTMADGRPGITIDENLTYDVLATYGERCVDYARWADDRIEFLTGNA